MKLGIAVVYLVREGNERLLDLHLESIRKHTDVPYAIYAGANRLGAGMRETLRRRPEVRILDLPVTALRTSEEHAFYLEQLIAAALDDGVSHVAVFHVDSFPIRPGWATETAAALSDGRPFAAAVRDVRFDDKPFTAFMLIRSEFLREARPRFLLDGEERRSAAYRGYRRRFPHHPDSGVGFGFLAYREGLEWLPLERSNRGEDHAHFGSIYGDTVFHLGAAAWRRKDFPGSRGPTTLLDLRARLGPALGRALPAGVRARLKRATSRAVPALDIEAKYAANEAAFEFVRQRLLADPEAYVDHLRFG
ncbi:MAG: hypothetical protein EPN53_10980 [Acidobacteria bacterium]|nr:MAG: hypothetical protein EPN53_10980 [Acidobacteriota bacterium]